MGANQKRNEPQMGAVQSESKSPDEEKSELLEAVLEKTELTLDSPIEIAMGDGRTLSIPKLKFIEYYLPKDATQAEKFHCFNQTRASQLSPLIQGECHYFRTGGRPLRLFTGYPVYLRKAYAAGMKHIEEPDLTFDEAGDPVSCTITIHIGGDRPAFSWTTYFSEVVGMTGTVRNSRWLKAPIFQFIKCATVNTLRWSGLVDFSLPAIQAEMESEPAAENMRSIPQEMIDRYEEITPGEVSASGHQMDLSPLRIKYFTKLQDPGIFDNDEQRHKWQEEIIGCISVSDWNLENYMKADDEIESGRIHQWVQDSKAKPEDEKRSQSVTDEPDEGKTQQRAQEPPEPIKDAGDVTLLKETHNEIKELLPQFPEQRYPSMGSKVFRERAYAIIGHKYRGIFTILESEGQKIIEKLTAQLGGKPDNPVPEDYFNSDDYMARWNLYVEQAGGRFANDNARWQWQEITTGEADEEKWLPEHFIKAFKGLDLMDEITEKKGAAVPQDPESMTQEQVSEEIESLRKQYRGLSSDTFVTMEVRQRWQERVVGLPNMTDWNLHQLETGIQEIKEYLELAPTNRLYEDLRFEYEKRIENRFADEETQNAWQADISEKTGDREQWGVMHYQKALAELARLEESPTKNDSTPEPEFMAQVQFKEIKELVAQLPAYHKNLGSVAFRERAAEITGRRPRGIRKYTFDEAKELILEFTDEVQDYNAKVKYDEEHPAPAFDFDR